MAELLALRNDVYRRPLETALQRVQVGPGWSCVDVGAGSGDVSVALAELVGAYGRVYAVDSDPGACNEVARLAAQFHAQVITITQAGEDLLLPEQVDLAFSRFLLLHVTDPSAVLSKMAMALKVGGWVVVQEPITSAGRINGDPFSMADAKNPDIGAILPKLVAETGLEVRDTWASRLRSRAPRLLCLQQMTDPSLVHLLGAA